MSKIKVTRFYQEAVSRRVLPGTYDIDDDRLLGKGAYLVTNGFAEYVDTPKPKPEPPKKPVKPKVVRKARRNADEKQN